MLARVAIVVVGLAGCDVVWGLSRDHGPDPVDASGPTCDPSSALNPAGCACNTVNAVQACFLGDNGSKSACRFSGQITCGTDHLWSACQGAAVPTQEVCFDDTDNDCDGTVDNGCTCANADNLCLGPDGEVVPGERLIVVPNPLMVNGMFVARVISEQPLEQVSLQTENGYCTGATAATCTVGGKCGGWNAIEFPTLTATIGGAGNMFSGRGSKVVHVRFKDQGPCVSASRSFDATVLVQ